MQCLDIGTGTGLLSLMLAQNTCLVLDAVELDSHAYEQAKQNIQNSPWEGRISIINIDILDYCPPEKYDLIISNPPFFEDDLKSVDSKKNKARHDTTLSLEKLLDVIDKLLIDTGEFGVLLPYHRIDYFIEEAGKKGLNLIEKVLIKQTPGHSYFRGILIFSREMEIPLLNEITIRESSGEYSEEFINLLKDYYL